jgi:hypothetical protein
VPTNAPAYAIVANGSPGVVVTVNPVTTAAVATYTIANVRASATLAGGAGTIKLEAPSGTLFPTRPFTASLTRPARAVQGRSPPPSPVVGRTM